MNFVDAAIEILGTNSGTPMHVEELCRIALDRELLSRPGKAPLRSMKGRLTTELKRGDDSRLEKVGDHMWQLRDEAAATESGNGEAAATESGNGEAVVLSLRAETEVDLEELLAPRALLRRAAEPEDMDDEEAQELYREEIEAGPAGSAVQEYEDEKTADEDRPMLPEIVAPRRDRHGRERRPRRERGGERGERGERSRHSRRGRKDRDLEVSEENASPRTAPPRTAPPRDTAIPERLRFVLPGNELADAATETLQSLRGEQSVQVKQLAQLMKKRNLLEGDPSRQWSRVKMALLDDARSREADGLRPRVVHRGRDQFALARVPDSVAAAETAAADGLAALRVSTHDAVASRLRSLNSSKLARVAELVLGRSGWTNIEWIKRVGPMAYGIGEAPAGVGPAMIGVRAGDDEIGRRAVGELRAGVAAKGLTSGVLLAPCDLADEALSELAKQGAAIGTMCGDAWVAAVIAAGIGVVRLTAPVVYLDADFFEDLPQE